MQLAPPVERLDVAAYRIPTEKPESDGTLEWDSTTLIVVHVHAGGTTGIGYTYSDVVVADLVDRVLAPQVTGRSVHDTQGGWRAMIRVTRNMGRPGIAACAISAVDAALWDLRARHLETPLVHLLGMARKSVTVYGSGGFTSYSEGELREQLARWADEGFSRVKMKVGREPRNDPARVRAARAALPDDVHLMVDANGAYTPKQAVGMAESFVDSGVDWFEEPVSSDDLDGLRLVRDQAPAPIDVTAGEYGYDLHYFHHMLNAGAVDVLQADATRCLGITGFMATSFSCQARNLPFSAHCAPSLHLHPCCAAPNVVHLEYFHDHARLESELFDGVVSLDRGELRPDLGRPGNGLELRTSAASRYAI